MLGEELIRKLPLLIISGIIRQSYGKCWVRDVGNAGLWTFPAFKSPRLKILSEYGSIFLGVTKMVGGWPSTEGL